jgi:hypothetical protein
MAHAPKLDPNNGGSIKRAAAVFMALISFAVVSAESNPQPAPD